MLAQFVVSFIGLSPFTTRASGFACVAILGIGVGYFTGKWVSTISTCGQVPDVYCKDIPNIPNSGHVLMFVSKKYLTNKMIKDIFIPFSRTKNSLPRKLFSG